MLVQGPVQHTRLTADLDDGRKVLLNAQRHSRAPTYALIGQSPPFEGSGIRICIFDTTSRQFRNTHCVFQAAVKRLRNMRYVFRNCHLPVQEYEFVFQAAAPMQNSLAPWICHTSRISLQVLAKDRLGLDGSLTSHQPCPHDTRYIDDSYAKSVSSRDTFRRVRSQSSGQFGHDQLRKLSQFGTLFPSRNASDQHSPSTISLALFTSA